MNTTPQPSEAKEWSAEKRNWHYSEPWRTEWSPEGIDIISKEEKVAQTFQKYPKEMEQANAARIVACVNFCAGVPTLPTSGKGTMRFLWDKMYSLKTGNSLVQLNATQRKSADTKTLNPPATLAPMDAVIITNAKIAANDF